jgi:hypothetical protein
MTAASERGRRFFWAESEPKPGAGKSAAPGPAVRFGPEGRFSSAQGKAKGIEIGGWNGSPRPRTENPALEKRGSHLRLTALLALGGGEGMGGVAAGLLLLLLLLLPAGGPPALPVLPDPVEQRTLKSDVVPQPLGFQPFVFQDFFPLREEFLIQAGLFHELSGGRRLLSWVSHAARLK